MRGIATVLIVRYHRATVLSTWKGYTLDSTTYHNVYREQFVPMTHNVATFEDGQVMTFIEMSVNFDAYATEEG
jgi:hypothetical protein